MPGKSLRRQVVQIASEAGAEGVAVALYDYHNRTGWSYHGETWFHAASTIKVRVLLGVYGAIHAGSIAEDSRVHVRNRFLSVMGGSVYRCEAARDSNEDVQRAIGRTMKVKDLAYHMIVTSSNLATNLLIEIVGLPEIQAHLDSLGLEGIELRRGVEDEAAWRAGVNNMVTANGLLNALRRIAEGRAFSEELSRKMLDILHSQEFRSGIPAGLPENARVANKTGEISTVAHDAGIVFLPDREPYVLVVLTQWEPEGSGRRDVIARISRAVYEHLMEG